MKRLASKPNVDAPGIGYTYGKIRDNDGSDNGTPVNFEVYDDFHQFFERMMDRSEITANDLPDNDTNGYQIYQSMINANSKDLPPLRMLGEALTGVKSTGFSFGPPCRLIGLKQIDSTHISAGYLYYNKEFYNCTGFIGTISDTAVCTRTSLGVLAITDAASGSGDFDFVDIVDMLISGGMYRKIVEIGDWNMDVTGTITLSHTISDWEKIRAINIIIRNDLNTLHYPFVSNQDGSYQIGSTDIFLQRVSSGVWDNANFDSTGYNRGWITIDYLP